MENHCNLNKVPLTRVYINNQPSLFLIFKVTTFISILEDCLLFFELFGADGRDNSVWFVIK